MELLMELTHRKIGDGVIDGCSDLQKVDANGCVTKDTDGDGVLTLVLTHLMELQLMQTDVLTHKKIRMVTVSLTILTPA